MSNESSTTFWAAFRSPTFYAALVAALVTSYSLYQQSSFHSQDREFVTQQDLRQERKKALFDVLQTIDRVYANTPFVTGKDTMKVHPESFAMADARDMFNRLAIYCKYPQQTIDTFYYAIGASGVHSGPAYYSAGNIQAFRRQVARELDLPIMQFSDSFDRYWLSNLRGAK
jgi:hypothetical protein